MRGIFVKYFVLLACLFIFFACSKTPSDAPIDSYRDVEINVDMNKTINNGLFDVNIDVLVLLIDSVNEYVMSDENGDQIFSITIPNLIFGKTYEYQYAVNETLEILEGDRAFIVHDDNNVLTDYYGELNPTTVIFSVNMSLQIEAGNFNVDNDYLDIAGDFLNNWNGTEDRLIDAYGDGIYKISFTNLESGDVIQFKFRINGSWDTAEFPGEGGNRVYTVTLGENSLEYWFNDENGS